MKIVKLVVVALEGVEAKRNNATLSEQNAAIEEELLKARAVNSTMHEHLVGAECLIETSKAQLDEIQLALERLACE